MYSPRLLCKAINRDTSNRLVDKAEKYVIYMQQVMECSIYGICGVLCHNIQSLQDRHFELSRWHNLLIVRK